MVLVHTSRSSTRSRQSRFVPGGLACAASARRLFVPTPLQISSSLKMASGIFSVKSVNRLVPSLS